MFRPDLPIAFGKDDLLGRASFARSLADALIAYGHKESLVAAVYGPWGSGKSSVVNLVLERVSAQSKLVPSDQRPLIVRFNPWNYSDQNQLIGQFFRSLSVALRRRDAGEDAKKAGEQLDVYAEFFAPLALIPDPTGLGNVLAVAVNVVLKKVGVALVAWGKLKAKDLDQVRKDLDVLLAKQKRKILIVIDDIDRLNIVEIRQVFQLVKALGDFPNTIYFLAFDQAIVARALSQEQGGTGEAYLEKIVQVPFQLPAISLVEVHKVLFSRLDELIKDLPSDKWDHTYWGNVFQEGLRYFFSSLRDVNRYINSLRLSFPMVVDEVNPVDFLAITALQVFEPGVYDGIRENESLFAGLLDSGYGMRTGEQEQARARCDEILGRRVVLTEVQCKELLQRLFPKVESIYEGMGYGSDFLGVWRAAGRVCSPEKFSIYFRLAIPAGDIPERELIATLGLASSKESFAEALLQQVESGRSVRFLERIQDFTKERIPTEHIQNVVSALMDVGDAFPEGTEGGLFERDTSMQVMRILYQLSQRFETQDHRFELFRRAIDEATRSIYTIVREVGLQGQQHGKRRAKGEEADPPEKRSVSAEQLTELEHLVASKIELWARDKNLVTHPELAPILYSWGEFAGDGEEKAQVFAQEAIRSDDGLVSFISAFESRSFVHSMSDSVGQFRYRVRLKSIEDFVQISSIEARLRAISSSEVFKAMTSEHQRAVQGFLDAVDGKLDSR